MRKFIIKSSVFSIVSLLFFLFVFSMADGNTDPFYIRFTTPKQESLILGTSKAAQGLQPDIFNKLCNTNLYNYAFTLGHSPFGATYLNSIKKKLKKESKSGIFIITVDPWSISSQSENPNDSISFKEVNRCLGNTIFVNIKPNIIYLVNNYDSKFYTILSKKRGHNVYLHENGWLEVSVDMDSIKVNNRINTKIKTYRTEHLPAYKYSSLRFKYLQKTIEYLNNFGEVYLIRLPIHHRMMKVENDLMPDFNHKIEALIPMTNGYLDMTIFNNDYHYIDGNHLYKSSGKKVSEKIAQWINKTNK